MDQYGVKDTAFCEVDITIFYNFTRTTKFAHMNGHWKDYDNNNDHELWLPDLSPYIRYMYRAGVVLGLLGIARGTVLVFSVYLQVRGFLFVKF